MDMKQLLRTLYRPSMLHVASFVILIATTWFTIFDRHETKFRRNMSSARNGVIQSTAYRQAAAFFARSILPMNSESQAISFR